MLPHGFAVVGCRLSSNCLLSAATLHCWTSKCRLRSQLVPCLSVLSRRLRHRPVHPANVNCVLCAGLWQEWQHNLGLLLTQLACRWGQHHHQLWRQVPKSLHMDMPAVLCSTGACLAGPPCHLPLPLCHRAPLCVHLTTMRRRAPLQAARTWAAALTGLMVWGSMGSSLPTSASPRRAAPSPCPAPAELNAMHGAAASLFRPPTMHQQCTDGVAPVHGRCSSASEMAAVARSQLTDLICWNSLKSHQRMLPGKTDLTTYISCP